MADDEHRKKKKLKYMLNTRTFLNPLASVSGVYRLDTLASKNKYMDVKIVEDGGWHFSQLKTPKEIEKKLLNDSEIHWINRYHSIVYKKIQNFLSLEEKKWLQKATKTL